MDRKILDELILGITEVLKGNVVRIVLYGSVARGTHTIDSDIDIAIFLLSKMDDEAEDMLSDLIVDLNLKYDKVLSVIDIDETVYRRWQNVVPFYQNMDREGIVLWKAA